MIRRIIGAAAVPAAALTFVAAPAAHAAAVDFHAIVALSNCSGSVVRGPQSADTDPAMVLTNGHCSELGFPQPGQVVTNRRSTRTFSLLNSSGQQTIARLRATQIEYSTMTDTDITLYKLSTTYQQLRSQYGVEALRLSADHPLAATQISVVSGYWKRIYTCKIDGFAYRLREASWTWKDSIRYTPECDTIGGTSGSPIIDQTSGQVVGVNNTGNEDGASCTLNNPCEVDQNGTVTVRPGTNYGQQTYLMTRCLVRGSDIDLSSTCQLPKP